MQAIIEGNLYEVEPAVKVILDRVMIENAELKRENKRLEEGYQKSIGVIAATDCAECKDKPVRHGYWIDNSNKTWSCSICQSWIPDEQHSYARHCLHCGAKMDLKDGESNE
jgi:hypothetical protein